MPQRKHSYSAMVSGAVGVVALLGSLWALFSFADDKFDGVSINRQEIGEIKLNTNLLRNDVTTLSDSVRDIEVDVRLTTLNQAEIQKVRKELHRSKTETQMLVEGASLSTIKRSIRKLESKDKFGTLEQWEHAELLQLRDDRDDLVSRLSSMQRQLNQTNQE